MQRVSAYVDRNLSRFLEEVEALCRIPSVSVRGENLGECAELLLAQMREIGLTAEILPMGGPQNPPLVYGRLDVPGARRTLFLYGHLDVQPAEPLEAWDIPPFEPQVRNGRMYGRGTSDNKGQFLAHLKAVEALQRAGQGVPVNLRILVDPQEEIGSPMLESFLSAHAELFRADFGYIADGGAGEGDRPIISFGNRGACYLEVRVRTARQDVHSGTFGGPMPNAAWRLVEFLGTLRDGEGRAAVKGFYDGVLPPTKAERAAMASLPFDALAWKREMGIGEEAGLPGLGHFEKIMFQPTLNLCGITAGYGGPGSKTVIPCEASAKIDMRLVKDQTPSDILRKFQAHARNRGFGDIEVIAHPFQYCPSKTPLGHPLSQVVIGAVGEAFGTEPLLEPVSGGSNPGHLFREKLGIPTVRVTYATADEGSHGPNENLSVDFFRKGILTTVKLMECLDKL